MFIIARLFLVTGMDTWKALDSKMSTDKTVGRELLKIWMALPWPNGSFDEDVDG